MVSAFIIYIHPQLQPDPNEEATALLRVILYKIDNAAFGVDIPEVPRWTGPPRTTVVAELFLYLSLEVTLASAISAIVFKQILNRYSATGTCIAIDFPRDIHSTMVRTICMGPLLTLHVAVALFYFAMPMYLWRVNILITAFVIASTFSVSISMYTLGFANPLISSINRRRYGSD